MARCNECNKFVSYDDTVEPEVNVDMDDTTITGIVRIVLTCAECGTELRQAAFDIDLDLGEFGETHDGSEEHELEVDCESVELTSRQQTTDANGKPITARARKTFYGYSAELTVKRSCGAAESYGCDDEIQASYLDEV